MALRAKLGAIGNRILRMCGKPPFHERVQLPAHHRRTRAHKVPQRRALQCPGDTASLQRLQTPRAKCTSSAE